MPVTALQLHDYLHRPPPPEPEIPDFLVVPLGRHDALLCECAGEDHCVAALWEQGCITTEKAAERLGIEL